MAGAVPEDREPASPATVSEVGEFAVIEHILAGRPEGAGVAVGPGDDAAVVETPDGRAVLCTDMLVEGRHFRLDWSTPHDVGRKAIAQNAADIEAMGARPTAFVVAFGVPPSTPASRVRELADGLWCEAGLLGAAVVGGDLVASPQWVVSVTALGDLGGRAPVTRGGARSGSVIAVAGHLGWSAAGLELLRRGIGVTLPEHRRHLVPEPPYGQGAVAADAGAEAMTDVSDGLLADLGHLAEASGVLMDLSRDALAGDVEAVTPAARAAGADPWSLVLTGGEDHALVACFPGPPPPGWRVVGRVRPGRPAVLLDGQHRPGPAGWQAFDPQ